jgi:hypothetical protein
MIVMKLGSFMNIRLEKSGSILRRINTSVWMVAAGIVSGAVVPSGPGSSPRNYEGRIRYGMDVRFNF